MTNQGIGLNKTFDIIIFKCKYSNQNFILKYLIMRTYLNYTNLII